MPCGHSCRTTKSSYREAVSCLALFAFPIMSTQTNYCPHCHESNCLDTAFRCMRCGRDANSLPKPGAWYSMPLKPAQGWECPRCRKVHSPFVFQCDCGPAYNITTDGVTTSEANAEPIHGTKGQDA
jgi:DNA-directed RNA polymerase subunit RPC12/RpoP